MTPEQRIRYARHRSLVELGDAGQRMLFAADVGARLVDARAESVRADYLARAGVPSAGASDEPSVASCDVAAFAGASYLNEAAASCLGALAAVERIKQITGAGRASESSLPPMFAEEL